MWKFRGQCMSPPWWRCSHVNNGTGAFSKSLFCFTQQTTLGAMEKENEAILSGFWYTKITLVAI